MKEHSSERMKKWMGYRAHSLGPFILWCLRQRSLYLEHTELSVSEPGGVLPARGCLATPATQSLNPGLGGRQEYFINPCTI